ncbi:Uncharacterised protein [Enterococcus gallinarum]|uniref:Uncharacterized protein n=1 Tax=Enterococcus gallinarum TaxID=1353 RepID=A0A376H7A1_ENTGA|nr:Uncharacterised protein [Enterococcus gallinarum]STD85861.1 Uncharacterised protein [Enterococcus gallinarum]
MNILRNIAENYGEFPAHSGHLSCYYDIVKKIKRAGYWTTHKILKTERGQIPSSLILLKLNKKTAY